MIDWFRFRRNKRYWRKVRLLQNIHNDNRRKIKFRAFFPNVKTIEFFSIFLFFFFFFTLFSLSFHYSRDKIAMTNPVDENKYPYKERRQNILSSIIVRFERLAFQINEREKTKTTRKILSRQVFLKGRIPRTRVRICEKSEQEK